MFDLLFRSASGFGLLAGLIYWFAYSWHNSHDLTRSVIKTLTLAPLALFWLYTSATAGTSDWPMALGLLAGVIGDALLSRPGPAAFLAGMAAFGLGHLIYALAMVLRAADLGFDAVSGAEIALIVGLLALLASTELWLAPRTGRLRQPVRAYVVLIGIMAAAAIVLPANPGQAELRIGAALFVLSDLLLALQLFLWRDGAPRVALGLLLWPAYVLGQLFLFWGSLLFWTFPKG